MADEKVFRIDGATITSLYSDDLLSIPGATVKHVERASRVEFDDYLKGWTVQFNDGTYLFAIDEGNLRVGAPDAFYITGVRHHAKAFATRQAALDAEIAFLNRRIAS